MFIKNLIKKILRDINPRSNFENILSNFRHDILAGITVGIIALPLALAFGEMSLLGPEAGIWGAIIGGLIGGIFGGCILSISGPTAPIASQIAILMTGFVVSTSGFYDTNAIFSIIFLSGLFTLCLSFFNISKFIHFIPYPVISGFMCGIGIIVILSQMKSFLGIESYFMIKKFDKDILFVSIPSLFIMLFWIKIRSVVKLLKLIPAPLATLIFGTSIAYFMNLDIVYIGDKMISSEHVNTFNIYAPDFSRFFEFFLPALTLASLVSIDSLLTCKIADNLMSSKHKSNQELFGQGFANMICGLFGAVSTATATMFTVSNIKFGAKTIISSISYGLTLFGILYGLKFFVASIPLACIAAILFKIGLDIMDYRMLPVVRKLPLSDIFIFITVLYITVFSDLMLAVLVGTLIALLINLRYFKTKYEHSSISISENNFKQKYNKVLKKPAFTLKPKGPLFFGSIQSLIKLYENQSNDDLLLIDLIDVPNVDLTSVYVLEDFIDILCKKKVKVIFLNVNSSIKEMICDLKLNEKFHLGL